MGAFQLLATVAPHAEKSIAREALGVDPYERRHAVFIQAHRQDEVFQFVMQRLGIRMQGKDTPWSRQPTSREVLWTFAAIYREISPICRCAHIRRSQPLVIAL